MKIPVDGLPKGYLVIPLPNGKTYLLGYLPEDSQKVKEIKYFEGETPPDLATCMAAINDWDVAISTPTK